MRRRFGLRRLHRALLTGPNPTPAQQAAATARLIADLLAGAGAATPAPATDVHTHQE